MLNKKGSEEKLHSGGGMLYNQRKQIEQRYKSHVRGQDAPGMIRNASKPTLELPQIHNTIKNDQSRNEGLQSNRSKKSLSNVSPHGNYNMPIVRKQSNNYPNDVK